MRPYPFNSDQRRHYENGAMMDGNDVNTRTIGETVRNNNIIAVATKKRKMLVEREYRQADAPYKYSHFMKMRKQWWKYGSNPKRNALVRRSKMQFYLAAFLCTVTWLTFPRFSSGLRPQNPFSGERSCLHKTKVLNGDFTSTYGRVKDIRKNNLLPVTGFVSFSCPDRKKADSNIILAQRLRISLDLGEPYVCKLSKGQHITGKNTNIHRACLKPLFASPAKKSKLSFKSKQKENKARNDSQILRKDYTDIYFNANATVTIDGPSINRDDNEQRQNESNNHQAKRKTAESLLGPKSLDRKSLDSKPSSLSSSMPPWLTQYEHDNSMDARPQRRRDKLGSSFDDAKENYVHRRQPFEVSKHRHNFKRNDNYHYDHQHSHEIKLHDRLSNLSFQQQQPSNMMNSKEQHAQLKLQKLHSAMSSGTFHSPVRNSINTNTVFFYYTPTEIYEVLDSIRVASHSNPDLMGGCADFLYLMLTLEEETTKENDNGRQCFTSDNDDVPATPIMTRDVLVAAAFHYCDCVRARKAGVYDYVRRAMEASLDSQHRLELEERQTMLWLSPVDGKEENEVGAGQSLDEESNLQTIISAYTKDCWNGEMTRSNALHMNKSTEKHTNSTAIVMTSTKRVTRGERSFIERYGEETTKIAAGAARLKRAEIMATAVNPIQSTDSGRFVTSSSSSPQSAESATKRVSRPPKKEDYAIMRNFLVSLSEDWRALVIRSAACLYRLQGIVDTGSIRDHPYEPVMLTTTTIRTAKDALQVYAPLAQRLGMQRLKSELENTAFRILYRRQYSVASSLYSRDIEDMKTILQVLSSRVEQLLRSDQIFMSHIQDVTVSSRVKEPYSLWRKIVRYRQEAAKTKDNKVDGAVSVPTLISSKSFNTPMTMSVRWVPDALALRVVLNARRKSASENQDTMQMREKMLCYFALRLISDVWPASNANEAKDYIKNPKPNGYQSLHYTASLMINGDEWPFEVQIRSEEMHRMAEFGVAAHWDYKQQNKKIKAFPDNRLPDAAVETTLALPPTVNSEEAISEILLTPRGDALGANVTNTPFKFRHDIAQKKKIASYIDALTSAREDIVKNNIFVFLSSSRSALDGRIVSVDPSACSVAAVLQKYGIMLNRNETSDSPVDGTLELYRNGMCTNLDAGLANGDVLTLPGNMIDQLKFD